MKICGFETKYLSLEEAKEDKELSYFYSKFKDKKGIGKASLPIEVLLSEEWEKNKEVRKRELLPPPQGSGFTQKLSAMTNPIEKIPFREEGVSAPSKSKAIDSNVIE